MKPPVILAVLLLLCVELSIQIPQLKNCPPDFALTNSMTESCEVITCDGPNSFSSLTCAPYQCLPGKLRGYKKVDNSKMYPECCGGPICED